MQIPSNPKVLLGPEGYDDAGVYLIAPGIGLVQTVDFFPPIVDDARHYGRIAAANAMSDVYAKGGVPLTVLQIVGFPVDQVPLEVLDGAGVEQPRLPAAQVVADPIAVHHASSPSIASPSRSVRSRSPRASWDFTVPTESWSTSATSSTLRCWR